MDYPIKHISASSLKKFQACPYSFKARYILKLQQPGNEHFAYGKSIHAAIELQIKMRKKYGKNLPTLAILKEYQRVAKREAATLDEDARDRFREMYLGGHTLTEQAYYKILELKPIDAEKYFKVDMGYKLPVLGYIDLLFEDGLMDTKTAAKAWDKAKVNSDYQFTIYNEAYKILYGEYPRTLGILLLDKKKAITDPKNSVYVQPVTRNGMHKEKLDLAVEELFEGMESNNYPRCMKPNCWACNL